MSEKVVSLGRLSGLPKIALRALNEFMTMSTIGPQARSV